MKDIDTAITGPNVMTSCGLLITGKPCPLPPWHAGPPIHIEDDPDYLGQPPTVDHGICGACGEPVEMHLPHARLTTLPADQIVRDWHRSTKNRNGFYADEVAHEVSA